MSETVRVPTPESASVAVLKAPAPPKVKGEFFITVADPMFISFSTGGVRSTVKLTAVAKAVAALVTFPALSSVFTQSFFRPSVKPVTDADQFVVPVAMAHPVALYASALWLFVLTSISYQTWLTPEPDPSVAEPDRLRLAELLFRLAVGAMMVAVAGTVSTTTVRVIVVWLPARSLKVKR